MQINFPNNQSINVVLQDSSYFQNDISSRDEMYIEFELTNYINIPLYSNIICDVNGLTYWLYSKCEVTKINSEYYSYKCLFKGKYEMLRSTFVRLTGTYAETEFSYTQNAFMHLKLICDSLNTVSVGITPLLQSWQVGKLGVFVDTDKIITINYENTTCYEALEQISGEFKTEFEVTELGNKINLKRIEYNENNILTLQYGQLKGVKSGIIKNPFSEDKKTTRLFPKTSERNIDPIQYGNRTLLMPAMQTIDFLEPITENIITYYSPDGHFIMRYSDINSGILPVEETFDATDIYPNRHEEITNVIIDINGYYHIVASGIPANLNYNDYMIQGQNLSIIFEDGMLNGKEFNVNYDHTNRSFEIIAAEIDYITMPNAQFSPVIGGQFSVFGMNMPAQYLCDNVNKTGASWELFGRCAVELYKLQKEKNNFRFELDQIFTKSLGNSLYQSIGIGTLVALLEGNFSQGIVFRITNIKIFLNNIKYYYIEISDEGVIYPKMIFPKVARKIEKLQTNQKLQSNQINVNLSKSKIRIKELEEEINEGVKIISSNYTLLLKDKSIMLLQARTTLVISINFQDNTFIKAGKSFEIANSGKDIAKLISNTNNLSVQGAITSDYPINPFTRIKLIYNSGLWFVI
ncbi:MAG: hypothetical protein LBV69_04375 [Bacteroidales bacterium]|jgi:hypothetical protein|nr:hypothetical protein [Bacteroidales bacterium]